MSYKVRIALHVLEQMAGAGFDQSSLAEQLKEIREDPRSGYEIRKDFANGWFIEVGDYRLYYSIDEVNQEVHCFQFDQFYYHW